MNLKLKKFSSLSEKGWQNCRVDSLAIAPREKFLRKIEWDNSFLLGFHDIDAHHQHLVGLLSTTHDEFIAGTPNLGRVLDELVDYAKYHFKSEELWMLDDHYPGIMAHKKEHTFFLQKVARIQKDFYSKSEYISLEMLQFLEMWITNHILKRDAEFGKYLSRNTGVV